MYYVLYIRPPMLCWVIGRDRLQGKAWMRTMLPRFDAIAWLITYENDWKLMLLCFYSSIILRAEGSRGPPPPDAHLSGLIHPYPTIDFWTPTPPWDPKIQGERPWNPLKAPKESPKRPKRVPRRRKSQKISENSVFFGWFLICGSFENSECL